MLEPGNSIGVTCSNHFTSEAFTYGLSNTDLETVKQSPSNHNSQGKNVARGFWLSLGEICVLPQKLVASRLQRLFNFKVKVVPFHQNTFQKAQLLI